MIEIHPNLFVGAEGDEATVRGQPGWYIIHACKEPYHRQALGYTGRAAAKDHPEYLIAHRPGRLILNLVDVDNVAYIGSDLVDAGIEAIRANIETGKVLIHCNQGASRSPTIAFLFLVKHTNRYRGLNLDAALTAFRAVYPAYAPARGMADYARINWSAYSRD